jgi:23S rRNA (adenine2503-C2)-methyltransferase
LSLSGQIAAADGTRKLLFTLAGGGTVEAVIIPAKSGQRTTLCVSSQLGCAQNCQFFMTALLGLRRNLSAAQIVAQALTAKRLLLSEGAQPLGNVVFMGMGEPLHNPEEVMTAVDILLDTHGFALSPARVTVSTSGLVPAMAHFARSSRASLAVSLNATTDEVRSAIMPINRKHNLEELLGTLRSLFGPASPVEHRRKDSVFFEYVLLSGVNDSDDDSRRLVDIARSFAGHCKVNLIAYNAVPGLPFAGSPRARLVAFRDALAAAGVVATIRESRGDDQMAACGQLGKPEEAEFFRPPPPRMRLPAGIAALQSAN